MTQKPHIRQADSHEIFLRVSGREQGLKQAAHDLSAGRNRNDVLETAVRVLELDPADDSVGYGGFPIFLGPWNWMALSWTEIAATVEPLQA